MEKEDWQKKGQGHRQRLREKFLEGGLDRFSDEEVVEFLLSLGTPRKDVKPQAREALKRFGSLSNVLSAPIAKLTEIKGIGEKNAAYLNLVHQVAGRYLRDRAKGQQFFNSSKTVFEFLFHSMRDLKREIFKVLFLNRKNELIADEDVFLGSLSGSAVYPREILSLALEHKAAGLVFVHNHPSGDPSPSAQDKRMTRDLVWASQLLMIQVLDHVIIGRNTYYSFADDGLIARFTKEFERLSQKPTDSPAQILP
ncbi:MAG: DNA repair protein RadC [Deltaproteobacteria bacterium]|nr:DNA repair protein RadC [Deltaproteobacteria bacterium]MBW1919179.1 DNA repair protein RadC [Deltaproteobacteria bacterium]MBW1934463.1 DNA repair protein RadC [Deltaproteobacteria bacterium]MBW1978055.1 DNA repair protein RadC [Deltaproteobacteria bacterium]MBW2044874.1 DNA repair protein RadC [Deltaproteobacteria bacterium]